MKREFYKETEILGGYIPERAATGMIMPIYRDISYHETETE